MTQKEHRLLLITGSTGFIGSHYVNSNKSKSYDQGCILRGGVCLFGGERMPLSEFIVRVLSRYKNVVLVHCATKYVRADEPYDLDDVISSNVKFPKDLVDAIAAITDLSVINLNSYFQYSKIIDYSDTIYTLSKKLFERYLADRKIKHVNLVLYDTFGRGDMRNKFIPLILGAIKSKKPLTIRNGELELAFTDVSVVVECIDYVIEQGLPCSTGVTFGVHQCETVKLNVVVDIAQRYHSFEVYVTSGNAVKPSLLELPPGFLPGEIASKSLNTFFKNA